MDELADKKEMMKLLDEIHKLIVKNEFMIAEQKLSHLSACLATATIHQTFDGAYRQSAS